MRRLVLHMMLSVDGFVAPPDRDESWMTAPDHDRDAASLQIAERCEIALIGRRVLDDMASYWPDASGDTPNQRAYIDRVNAMRKLVVTHADEQLPWNASALVTDEKDFSRHIMELKQAPGGDILAWGGAGLVRQLVAHDLVDEYQLIVQPTALGQGHGLFADLRSWRGLELLDAQPFRSGAVFLRYGANP